MERLRINLTNKSIAQTIAPVSGWYQETIS